MVNQYIIQVPCHLRFLATRENGKIVFNNQDLTSLCFNKHKLPVKISIIKQRDEDISLSIMAQMFITNPISDSKHKIINVLLNANMQLKINDFIGKTITHDVVMISSCNGTIKPTTHIDSRPNIYIDIIKMHADRANRYKKALNILTDDTSSNDISPNDIVEQLKSAADNIKLYKHSDVFDNAVSSSTIVDMTSSSLSSSTNVATVIPRQKNPNDLIFPMPAPRNKRKQNTGFDVLLNAINTTETTETTEETSDKNRLSIKKRKVKH